jgi:hypothetical protein
MDTLYPSRLVGINCGKFLRLFAAKLKWSHPMYATTLYYRIFGHFTPLAFRVPVSDGFLNTLHRSFL